MKKISYVVLVKPESKLQILIPRRVSYQPRDHWNYCIWICLVLQHIESIGGNYYCIVVVDDYSKYSWVFFLHDKADTYDTFKNFITRVGNEFELKVKKVRSDNGSEFRNTRVEELCDEKGIKHEFSTKYTPEQNGLVERKNRTLIDMAKSMLSGYNVLDSFGPKQSTRLVMLRIDYIVIDFTTRPHMNCLFE